MAELRKYGVATTVVFPLVSYTSTRADFSTSITFTAGDFRIIRDEATAVNCTSTGVFISQGIYSLAISAAEISVSRALVIIQDGGESTAATKLFEDQAIIIETYGSTLGQHSVDIDSSDGRMVSQVAGLNAGVITSASIAAAAFLSTAFGVGFLTSTGIAADAFLSTAFGSSAITARILAADAITSTHIAASAITSTHFGTSAINDRVLATDAITSTKIAANAIGSTQLQTGTLTAAKLASATITTGNTDAGVFAKIASDVNVEVLDVLTVDTFGESTAVPVALATLERKWAWMQTLSRNEIRANSTSQLVLGDTGNTVATAALSVSTTVIPSSTAVVRGEFA